MKHLWRILGSARQLRRYYILIGLFTVLVSAMNLLQPLLTGWAIDEIKRGSSANLRYVVVIACFIFVLDLLSNLFSNISGYFGDQMTLKLNRILSRRYYEHILTLPQSYFDTELTGKIIGRLNRSISQLTNFMQTVSNNFLQFLFSTVFALILVAHYSWQVALMMLSLYPVYIFLTMRSSTRWQDWQAEKNSHFDAANGRFGEVIGQVEIVKSYLREKHEVKVFDKEYGRAVAINEPQSRYWHSHDFRRRLFLNVVFFAIYLYTFIQGAQGHLSAGDVVAIVLFGNQIRLPIFTISFLVDAGQRAVADSKDYFEVMELTPDIQDKPTANLLQINRGQIDFKDVSFSYQEGTPVLKHINLAIEPRSKLALVGESGEGKTTLTNLLLRLYEPNIGTVTIDGQDISAVTQLSLRDSIGVVFQEPALFSGTIRENIAYGKPEATLNEVETAAKAANAAEFIAKFDKQYDTPIGERGVRLSGGQKQRLAIARAILKDAPILILDEATSSLDSRSEQLVHEALQRLMKQRTTIIIAHRLSTIKGVDTIVTLKNGQIDETGSPQQLAASGGIYAQLLELQQLGAGATKDKKLKAYDISGV